jgi:hypothetical protein
MYGKERFAELPLKMLPTAAHREDKISALPCSVRKTSSQIYRILADQIDLEQIRRLCETSAHSGSSESKRFPPPRIQCLSLATRPPIHFAR